MYKGEERGNNKPTLSCMDRKNITEVIINDCVCITYNGMCRQALGNTWTKRDNTII
jgi:hypothetical protein